VSALTTNLVCSLVEVEVETVSHLLPWMPWGLLEGFPGPRHSHPPSKQHAQLMVPDALQPDKSMEIMLRELSSGSASMDEHTAQSRQVTGPVPGAAVFGAAVGGAGAVVVGGVLSAEHVNNSQ
jgi:hypothetical protein